MSAAERLVIERGARAVTVAGVCESAGVSRTAFRRCYAGRTALLIALYDELDRRARATMREAYLAEESWLEGVRAALGVLLAMLDANLALARFMLVDSAIDESLLPLRRSLAISEFADALERDRPEPEGAEGTLPFGGEAIVAAIVAILHGRLLEQPVPALVELCGPLMGMIVLPYLGPAAARAELERPARQCTRRHERRSAKPPREPVRMTLRTRATLRAIAAQPGLNNSQIAAKAGITDPGQASRLLARLRACGLIECEGGSHGRPVGKAWRLAAKGRALLERNGHLP